MKTSGWRIAAAAVCVAAGISVGARAAEEKAGPTASTNTVKQQTMCPVMDNGINRKLFVDHDGKRIYVCCNMCIGQVKKDPAKYIKQLEDQGITLDKAEPPKADGK